MLSWSGFSGDSCGGGDYLAGTDGGAGEAAVALWRLVWDAVAFEAGVPGDDWCVGELYGPGAASSYLPVGSSVGFYVGAVYSDVCRNDW